MTDTFDAPAVEAIETPAIAEIVPPVEAPVEQTEEVKQVEKTFTQEEHEKAIQAAKAKLERKYEREYRQRLEQENATLRQRDAPKVVEPPGKPERQNYADDVTFIEELADWKAGQRIEKTISEREQQSRQSEYQRELQSVVSTHEKRVEAIRATNPDYDEIVGAQDLNISKAMAEAIVLSENGPKLALYLGKNPEVSDRIARMHPSLAGIELGKLEAKLSVTPAKTLSNAPAPMKSVISGRALVKDLESASQEEFEKELKKAGSRYVR